MTSQEFRAALAHLGMQQNWLASELGVSPQAVNRWARGTLKVPQYVGSHAERHYRNARNAAR